MSTSFEIGPARIEEAAQIARMSRWLVEHGFRWSWTPARVERAIRDRESEVIVARCDGQVIGFAVMRFARGLTHLCLFGVHPRFQRRGVGKRLLGWLESMARLAALGTYLEVRAANVGARLFYRTLGYAELEVRRKFYSGVEDAVVMVNDLLALRPRG